MRILICLMLCSLSCFASEVKLAWNASPSPNVGYRLYAGTNSLLTATNLTLQSLVKLDAKQSLGATVRDLDSGNWFFVATAYNTNTLVESAASNELIISVPVKPANMRSVVVQWQGTVSGTNWLDAAYFKLKFE